MATFPEHFPKIETERLQLIELQPAMVGDMFSLFTNQQVTKYYFVFPLNEEADMLRIMGILRKRYEDKLGIRWGITLKGKPGLIGTIGYNSLTVDHKGSVGYALQPAYWGQGIISEALRAVVEYGFDNLGFRRVEADMRVGRTNSEKVLLKCGFTHEGLLRQWMVWEGKYYDMNMFSVVRY